MKFISCYPRLSYAPMFMLSRAILGSPMPAYISILLSSKVFFMFGRPCLRDSYPFVKAFLRESNPFCKAFVRRFYPFKGFIKGFLSFFKAFFRGFLSVLKAFLGVPILF